MTKIRSNNIFKPPNVRVLVERIKKEKKKKKNESRNLFLPQSQVSEVGFMKPTQSDDSSVERSRKCSCETYAVR